jgi:hypothetical protein
MANRTEFQEQIAIREDKDREEIEFLETNQKKLITQVAEYEQELYEKDQYIQRLENEIRGLKVLTAHRSERGFQCQ